MTHDAGNVVGHLRSHAGATLQAVFVYRGGDHRDLYRRDDLAELHGPDPEATVLREVRSGADVSGDDSVTRRGHSPALRFTCSIPG